MYSIKVTVEENNEYARGFVSKDGKIVTYKTKSSAKKAADKLAKKYKAIVVPALKLIEL